MEFMDVGKKDPSGEELNYEHVISYSDQSVFSVTTNLFLFLQAFSRQQTLTFLWAKAQKRLEASGGKACVHQSNPNKKRLVLQFTRAKQGRTCTNSKMMRYRRDREWRKILSKMKHALALKMTVTQLWKSNVDISQSTKPVNQTKSGTWIIHFKSFKNPRIVSDKQMIQHKQGRNKTDN